jgi:hypothetical protein
VLLLVMVLRYWLLLVDAREYAHNFGAESALASVRIDLDPVVLALDARLLVHHRTLARDGLSDLGRNKVGERRRAGAQPLLGAADGA